MKVTRFFQISICDDKKKSIFPISIFLANGESGAGGGNVGSGNAGGAGGMSRSVPSSPSDRKGNGGGGGGSTGPLPIVGSAENLVGRVSIHEIGI